MSDGLSEATMALGEVEEYLEDHGLPTQVCVGPVDSTIWSPLNVLVREGKQIVQVWETFQKKCQKFGFRPKFLAPPPMCRFGL